VYFQINKYPFILAWVRHSDFVRFTINSETANLVRQATVLFWTRDYHISVSTVGYKVTQENTKEREEQGLRTHNSKVSAV
jgi:hypothetical protein